MSKLNYLHTTQANQSPSWLAVNIPTVPANQKQPLSEKRVSDPSSCLPKEKSYPIPSFFEYRARPKEYDSL